MLDRLMTQKFDVVTVSTCSLLALSLAGLTKATASERRQMDAHEHGVTALNVAADNSQVLVELEGPAMNFVGFEHTPRTDEQKQAIADATAALREPDRLFAFNSEAGCSLVSMTGGLASDAEHDHGDSDHDDHGDHHDDHGHDDHGADDAAMHSEFVARYEFACGSSAELSELTVTLFERFPLTSSVEVSFVGEQVQTFRELTADSQVLSLQP